MSLESSIAGFTTQAGQLLDLPQQIASAAQAQIALIGQEYVNRIANMTREVWVDAVTGVDTNPGTQAAPFRSLNRAVSMVPPGGRVTINLLSDFELAQDVPVVQRQVLLRSAGTTRRTITFARYAWISGANSFAAIRYFSLIDGSSIECDNVKIVMPPIDGNWGANTIVNWGAFRSQQMERLGGVPHLGFYNCEISLPVVPFVALLDRISTVISLVMLSTLVSGQPLNGKLFGEATNSAGTATAGLPWLLTNLTTI